MILASSLQRTKLYATLLLPSSLLFGWEWRRVTWLHGGVARREGWGLQTAIKGKRDQIIVDKTPERRELKELRNQRKNDGEGIYSDDERFFW